MQEIKDYNESIFEGIKHIDENGLEYWSARELQKVLEYKEWRNFKKVIDIAKKACNTSKNNSYNHFVEVNKMVITGDSTRKIIDYKLSRYACYLIVQNGDSRKKVIALGQTYFAIQTRRQELLEQELTEDEKRLMRRQDLTRANKNLSGIAKVSGVRNYGKFVNEGYKGLYNGETVSDIRNRKELKKSENISDYMNSEELGANIFRATQTEAKLKRESIIGDTEAGIAHYTVGKEVRNTIKRLGGTMPENLETPEKSIKQIEKEEKIKIGDNNARNNKL